MKAKKLLAMVLALLLVISMTACGTAGTEETTAPATDPAPTEPAPTEENPPVVAAPSVDFEDGSMSFVALYEGMANSDASVIEIADYNGSKALKITNGSGKVPYVGIDVWSLLGENAANVASIEMTMGIENPDGKFYACSGDLMLWNTKELSKTKLGWSVYMPNKNPKVASFVLKDQAFSADVAPIMVVSLSTDNGATAGAAPATLYIDDIRFLDAAGNVLTADTAAAFAAPKGFSGAKDMSNLSYLKATTVALEGMSGITGTAWGQNGVEMTPEFLAALVPGAIIEIEYSSTAGNMWIVLPDAAAGWSRVQQQTAATNNSKNIAQITYEQIAAVCGEDVTTWGARLQCESEGDWEVYSVKVGQNSGLKNSARSTVWYEGSVTGGAWGQGDVVAELTQEQLDALVPGTYLEIAYTTTSATGDLWIVLPDAAAGWSRVEMQTAACNGSICQISYEQIAAVCGEDKSTWGLRIQGESDGDWEIFSMKLVNACFYNTSNNAVVYEGSVTGGAWGQSDVIADLTTIADKLVPGSVITIQYTTTSPTGELWIVLPDAAAGWSRVQQQTAACNGTVCQITYEQIAAVCGDDISTWGARIQGESDGDWEIFSMSVGMAG